MSIEYADNKRWPPADHPDRQKMLADPFCHYTHGMRRELDECISDLSPIDDVIARWNDPEGYMRRPLEPDRLRTAFAAIQKRNEELEATVAKLSELLLNG